ncbi:MAG: hypothetical protein Q8K71_12785 [Polaromonas sp.]|nr:hypothetical protein [Polaromonas sp.]MDP3751411.1 hypothetical protein [Polaromonas sp.]
MQVAKANFKAEINKVSLVIKFNWAEVLFYGFFVAYGFFGAATPSHTNFISNVGVGILQIGLLSFFLALLGVMAWKWGSEYQDLIVVSGKDLLAFAGISLLLFGLSYQSLGQSIQGDESAYLMLAYGHAIKVLLKFGDHFAIVKEWPVKYLVQLISLSLVAGLVFFIWASRKLEWPKRIAVVLITMLFCRILIMYFGGNPSPHPPLGGGLLLISGSLFGINDFALKSGYFVGYVIFIFGAFKIVNKVAPWCVSLLFALSIGTIPLSLHLAAIVENSIWSLICFTLIMLELAVGKHANLVRLASLVSIMTLFRQSIFIGYVPILIIFAASWRRGSESDFRKRLLKIALPSIVFIPFLMQSIIQGTPSTAALGDQTDQLGRVIGAFESGIIFVSIANSVSIFWILFIPFAFIFWGRYRAQGLAFLSFFVVALVLYYSIHPGLHGLAKYQAEYAVPFMIMGALICFQISMSLHKKELIALLLVFIMGFNTYTYLEIPERNRPIDELIDSLGQASRVYDNGYHILCGYPYEFGRAYDDVKKLGLTGGSYTIGVTYGVFLEIINGYSLKAVQEAESISRLQKKLNEKTNPESLAKSAVENIEKDPRIKTVMLGAIQKRRELIDEFVSHGWTMHAKYENMLYGSSVIVMTKISG